MNYHILIDEKFIDDFIIDAESVSNQNRYIFAFAKPAKMVKSHLGIFAPIGTKSLDEIIFKIQPEDKVFIHWFHFGINIIIDKLPKKTQIFLMFWGGDFLGLPYNCGYDNKLNRFLYEPKSFSYLKYITTKEKNHHLKFLLKSALYSKNPFIIIKSLFEISYKTFFFFNRNYKYVISERTKFLKRLTAICHWNRLDIDILETIYNIKLKMMPFSYGVGIDQLHKPKYFKKQKEIINIFLGNSDTLTNNHLDAFEILKQFKNDNFKIYCPLNYEKQGYAKFVNEKGKEIFGNKFIGILDFLPRSDYYKLMDKIDICFMYHIRTQAGGNILAFLKKGAKVYLNKKSSIYKFYKDLGFPIFDAEEISLDKTDFNSSDLVPTLLEDNILWESAEKRSNDLKKLLS